MRPPKPQNPEGVETLGLGWRPRKTHWNGYWIARQDIADRGYPIKSRFLWSTKDRPELTLDDWQAMSTACAVLQGEMLNWGKPEFGKFDALAMFDDTVASLVEIYLKDPDSNYKSLRYQASISYARQLETIRKNHGPERVSQLTFRDFKRWYESALEHDCDKPLSYAHQHMTFIRLVFAFGTLLKLPGCAAARAVLSEMKFELPKSRAEIITGEQVVRLRKGAHDKGRPSIAFAQTLQDCLMVRQKDVIGELIPKSDPGLSDVHMGEFKWVAGIRWEELDANFTLTHRLSKSIRGRRNMALTDTGKTKVWNFWNYPPVIEELCLMAGASRAELRRDLFPASGPMVIAEHSAKPWRTKTFAKEWRKIATHVGIPENVQNRDTRAGAATDAGQKGADVDRKAAAERVRPALGHSNEGTTQIYLRADDEATARIAELRFGKQTRGGE